MSSHPRRVQAGGHPCNRTNSRPVGTQAIPSRYKQSTSQLVEKQTFGYVLRETVKQSPMRPIRFRTHVGLRPCAKSTAAFGMFCPAHIHILCCTSMFAPCTTACLLTHSQSAVCCCRKVKCCCEHPVLRSHDSMSQCASFHTLKHPRK